MRYFASFICAAILSALPIYAQADEQADAQAITELLLSDEIVEATFGAVGTLMGDVMIAEFKKNDVDISDDASVLFSKMLLDKMVEQMGPALRGAQQDIYMDNLSGEELRDYLAFLNSSSGQAVAAMQGVLIVEGARRGEIIGQQVAPGLLSEIVLDMRAGRIPDGVDRKSYDELVQLLTASK
ncbi:MAG: DUF2059 domain-containing protein [Hyphomonadaceae bacterium]